MLRTTLDNDCDRDGEGGASSEGDDALTASRNDWTNSDNQMVVTQIIGKQKCVKIARDFNKETACYYTLVMHLGSICDNPRMRDELNQCRKRALDLAQRNKAALLPHLRGRMHGKEESESYEKLWSDYASCLELLHQHLLATLTVERRFPVDSNNELTTLYLIRTGLTESEETTFGICSTASAVASSTPSPSSSSSSSLSSSDSVISTSNAVASASDNSRADFSNLEKDISDITKVLTDIRNLVYLKPWDIQPEHRQITDSKTANSFVESGLISVFKRRFQSKRFICLILFAICIVILVIVSVVLALRL